jgi:regulator of RNase E activity RraA
VVDFGVAVTVHGMATQSGDLIHADQHGAVVVPVETVAAMKPAFDKLTAQEARIIQAARTPGVTAASIKAAMKG